jgi:nucleoid DNA-binding protein
MKKPEIVKRMARQSGVSTGEAADRLDCAVRHILAELRRRHESPFPGLGRFMRDDRGAVRFEPDGEEERG